MKRDIKRTIFAALISALLMTGCMKIDMAVELKRDGTASMAITYAMDSEYASEDEFEGHEVQHFNFDGKDYVGYSETIEYRSYAQMSQDLMTQSEDGATMFSSANADKNTGLFKDTYVFDAVTENLVGEAGTGEDDIDSETSKMMAQMIDATFSVTMPGKITAYSGGTLEGNTVTYQLITNEVNVYHVESTEIKYTNIIVVSAAILALIGLCVYSTAKKKKAQAAYDYDAPSFTPYTPTDTGSMPSQQGYTPSSTGYAPTTPDTSYTSEAPDGTEAPKDGGIDNDQII